MIYMVFLECHLIILLYNNLVDMSIIIFENI